MNDLARLLEASPHHKTRELLRAALRDVPRAGTAERVLAALGASAVASAGMAAAAGASARSALSGGLKTAAAPSVLSMVVKWFAIGAVSGGVLATGSFAAQSRGVGPVVHGRSSLAQGHPARAAVRQAAPNPSAPASSASEETRPAPAVSAAKIAQAPAPSGASDRGKLAREVESIDRVRRSLAAGDAAAALRELGRYERLVETHVLDREATVLRIEALAQSGQAERARALFETYLEKYPGDPHAARLRARMESIRE